MATVTVPSVWPAGSNLSITGAVVSGDGHVVGASPGVQFGAVTIHTLQTRVVGSVASAQAFGIVTRIAGGVSSSSSGVPSAQAFGALTIKTVVRTTIVGVGSAQAFGTPRAAYIQHLVGLGSAQAFGVVTTRSGFTKAVGGVSSAQAFGVPRPVWAQAFQVAGIGSAQAFGSLTIKGAIKPQAGGVPSAQAFGSLSFLYSQQVSVLGLDSPQAFGVDLVAYVDWLHDLHCIGTPDNSLCGEVICGDGSVCGGYGFLDELVEDDLDLAALDCLIAEIPLCGEVICGDGTVCGGHRYIVVAGETTLDLNPDDSREIALTPLVCA